MEEVGDQTTRSKYKELSQSFGTYPDTENSDFVTRILQKREFADAQQSAPFTQDGTPTGPSPCDQDEFEATPVQRFVGNFMSPDTPYMSMLLYHGVGVGKTCAGVTVAERWLAAYPRMKVIIVAPPSIQAGFKATICNTSKVIIPDDQDEPNVLKGCTGDSYMRMTTTLYEKRRETIQYRVNRAIDSRYDFYGYISLKNYIKNLIDGVKISDPVRKEQMENNILRQEFSGRLLIIDEAHNLRDIPTEKAKEEAVDSQADEKDDMKSGKELTPYLMRVLRVAEGLKLLLLTGTPMYNTHSEIVFLMNLVNANEKRGIVSDTDVFTIGGQVTPRGEELLAEFASRHVSFMRGENPRSFPMRLMPEEGRFKYPAENPVGVPIADKDKVLSEKLPIVGSYMTDKLEADYFQMHKTITGSKGGMSPIMIETLVQNGNFVWPVLEGQGEVDIESRVGYEGFIRSFESLKEDKMKPRKYRPRGADGGKWMSSLDLVSPKAARVIQSVSSAEGVCFVYSRFVQSGALPLALFMEVAGLIPYGREPLLSGGPRAVGGRLCYCGMYEKAHTNVDHAFSQATYALLTGDKTLTKRVDTLVKASQAPENKDGKIIKVIIGSQIAAEGIDLRYIRECHIFDSWFHLNKTEQIIGRSIRFCSHSLLPEQKRNTTIFMHVNLFSVHPNETADLYSYRLAYKKAEKVGNVSRIIKRNAVDCNLTHPSVLFAGYQALTGNKRPIDSHNKVRDGVSINDMPFTAVCDWLETCDFKCATAVPSTTVADLDDMTYSAYAAAWKEARMRDTLRRVFTEQIFIKLEDLPDMFRGIPAAMVMELLSSVLGNKTFIVYHRGRQGYLIYRNRYILFQPIAIEDTTIPMAMRAAYYPVKRDDYVPRKYVAEVVTEKPITAAKTKTTINAGWAAIKQWLGAAINDPNTPVPVQLDEYIESVTGRDMKEMSTYTDKIKAIRYLIGIIPRQQTYVGALFNVLVEYFWDCWMPADWKVANWKIAFEDIKQNMEKYLIENIMNLHGVEVYRFFDIGTLNIKYICNDNECPPALVEQIKEIPDMFDKDVSIAKTGAIYGFLTYKKDQLVFKTNAPPAAGQKLGTGKECENDSRTATHKLKIYEAIDHLKRVIGTDMGINEQTRFLGAVIVNPAQTCIILELLLRFMDEIEVEDKRWFYRPVEAFINGHRGRK
jgi:hypothetical protein